MKIYVVLVTNEGNIRTFKYNTEIEARERIWYYTIGNNVEKIENNQWNVNNEYSVCLLEVLI